MTPQNETKCMNLKIHFTTEKKITYGDVAEGLLNIFHLITFQDTEEIYAYNESKGIYELYEKELLSIIQWLVGNDTNTHFVNETLNSIRRQTFKDREIIGKDKNLIPLNNGIYDFKEKTLQLYSYDFVFLTKHPVNYNLIEKSIDWKNPIDSFLEEITESQEDVLLIKEMIGYCYYRSMPFQNFFIFYGKGGNGKGVLLNIIENMLGKENISNESLQSIVENKFAPASLYMKNANLFGDLPQKAFKETSVLKEATGGDTLRCERKFKNPFGFKNYAKLIASCNEVPESPDMSDGFFDRPIIINFPKRFRDTPQEKRNLGEELCTEINLTDFFISCIGAFSIALENNYLIRKEPLEKKKEKYMMFSNSTVSFCYNCLEYDPESELTSEAIYKEYKSYCEKKNVPPKDERIFFHVLYATFTHKVYKKRRSEQVEFGKERRWFVIVGLDWKGWLV